MKITFFFPKLNYGGIERISTLLANALAEKDDLEIDFLLLKATGGMLPELSSKVNIIDLNLLGEDGVARWFDPAFSRPSSPLVTYLKEQKPDVVLSLGHTANRLFAWLKLLYRLPFLLVMSEHNTFSVVLKTRVTGHFYSGWSRWLRVFLSRCLYRLSPCCVCVSEGVADDLVTLRIVSRDKLKVIHNPLIGSDFYRKAQAEIQDPWFLPNEPPVIINFGRLAKEKALDVLIKAFHLLRADLETDARLMIVGDGAEKEHLVEMVHSLGLSSHVRFMDFTKNPFPYVKKSALMVLSSVHEGLSNVLVESLACGTNVVSTDCPSGPREILEDGKWGWLIPVGDFRALAVAMQAALENPKPSDELRRRGAFFSVERAVDSYHKLFLSLVPQKNGVGR